MPRIYRVDTPDSDPTAEQVKWVATQDEAKREARGVRGGGWEAVEFPTGKAEIIAFLNRETAVGAATSALIVNNPPPAAAPRGAPRRRSSLAWMAESRSTGSQTRS